jgi:hypothetical protein
MVKASDRSAIDAVRPTRVVVLVDASPDALHALEMAADLARRHGVPLLAVSVEEPDHAKSKAYSFASEVGAVSGSIRPVDPALSARRRERGPAGIRRAVERASRAADVTWRLMVLQGRLVDEVLALSEPGDCLMLGRVGWSSRLGRKLGRTPLILARRAGGTVHICSADRVRDSGRVAVLLEDVESDRAVLALAAGRSRATGRELVVLSASTSRDEASRIGETVDQHMLKWRLRSLPALHAGPVLRALAEEGAAELVVGRGGAWLDSPAAARVLDWWRMPVLVLGETAG